MIGDLKPYPEYKESGQPWFGQVPSHWVVSPLARLARLKTVINQSDRQLLSVYLQRGVVRFSDVAEKRTNTTSEDLSKYQAVDPGDFVLNNQQAWRGSVGVSDFTGIVSPAYLVLTLSNQYLPRYANSLFRDQSMVAQYLVCSKGVGTIQRNLYWPHLKRVGVIVPPPDEQAAIVSFLDWANGRLERAIRAKRKVIALLNEQKQAIIHRAVTRGLDPSVPLKGSGVPWLGDIPQNWEVVRSRRLFSARKELARPDDVQLSATQAFGVIPQDEFERRVGRRVVKISMHLDKRKHVERGDFVMSMRSFQGGLERAWADGAIRSSYVVLQPSESVHVDFFTYVLKSRGYVGALQCTADFIRDGQDLTEANFRKVDLPLPPKVEQSRIAEFILNATSRLIHDVSRLEREIDLLREYRTRLVADVVTGKFDVRDTVSRLPNEELLPELVATDDEPDDLPNEEEDDG